MHSKSLYGQKRRLISSIQRLLLLSIWLLTLVSVFLLIYTDYYPVYPHQPVIRYKEPMIFNQKVRDMEPGLKYNSAFDNTSSKIDISLYKGTLTKAVYPLTLTAPFIIETPELCAGNVTVLVIVHTAMDHFERRIRLRLSLGNINLFKSKYHIKIAFLLGRGLNKTEQKLIEQESTRYHDIVQGDFIDSYRNLTLKGVMAYRWITAHCGHAKLILKIDDDIYVNIFKIIEYYVPKYSVLKKQIVCNKMYPSPVLRRKTKWSVDDDYFRGVKYYPPYCSGFTVLMTPDTVRIMYTAAHFTPFFWVDDVYLFGLLPSKGKITHGLLNKNVSLHMDRCQKAYASKNPELVSCGGRNNKDFKHFWNRSIETMSGSIREHVNETALRSLNI